MTFRNFCHPSMTNDTFSDTFFHSHFSMMMNGVKPSNAMRHLLGEVATKALGFLCNQQKIYNDNNNISSCHFFVYCQAMEFYLANKTNLKSFQIGIYLSYFE